MVVTPVYRELQNGNILRHLEAFADLENPHNLEIDFVLVVNDRLDSDAEIRRENQATLQILEGLAGQRFRSRREDSPSLRRLKKKLQDRGLQLHVIDSTGMDRPKANIGEIRDIGNQFALSRLATAYEQHFTVISQMDADTLPDPRLLKSLVTAYQDNSIDYVLLDLEMRPDSASPREISARLIRGQLNCSTDAFRRVLEGRMPGSGTPRITSRADAIREVNGVTHLHYAEDQDLIKKFRKANLKGQYLPLIKSATEYRGRPDGYDAADNFKRMKDPVLMEDHDFWNLSLAQTFVEFINEYFPSFYQDYSKIYQAKVEQRKLDVQKRRQDLLRMISDEAFRRQRMSDSFLSNSWLVSEIETRLSSYVITSMAERSKVIFDSLTRDFPVQLGVEMPVMQSTLFQIESSTQVLYSFFEYFRNSPDKKSALKRTFFDSSASVEEIEWQWIEHWILLTMEYFALNQNLYLDSSRMASFTSLFTKMAKQLEMLDLEQNLADVFYLFMFDAAKADGGLFKAEKESYRRTSLAYARLMATLDKIKDGSSDLATAKSRFRQDLWGKLLFAWRVETLKGREPLGTRERKRVEACEDKTLVDLAPLKDN